MIAVQQQLNESDVMTCIVDDFAVQHISAIVMVMLSNYRTHVDYTI